MNAEFRGSAAFGDRRSGQVNWETAVVYSECSAKSSFTGLGDCRSPKTETTGIIGPRTERRFDFKLFQLFVESVVVRTLPIAVCLVITCNCFSTQAEAQNIRQDYLRNVPRTYSPDDPWTVGKVMRNQIGHGGFFYNCDREECKRYSPYIRWQTQPQVCRPKHPIRWDLRQQRCEIIGRIRDGACLGCNSASSGCQSCGGSGVCTHCHANTNSSTKSSRQEVVRKALGESLRESVADTVGSSLFSRGPTNRPLTSIAVKRDFSIPRNMPAQVQTEQKLKTDAQPTRVADERRRLLDLYRR